MLKKLISAALSAAMLLTAASVPAAMPMARGEKVTFIVEVEGAPLLETKNAAFLGAAAYMETAGARAAEADILSVQSAVKSDIKKRLKSDVDEGYTYTSVFNGFSMQGYLSDIERIKAIDGVKNVYISRLHAVPERETAGLAAEPKIAGPEVGADMMNAGYMYDRGYDGHHQAIAILDSEFDVGHDFFTDTVDDPRFTKDDIAVLLAGNDLNINASANQVYKSSKIPFAYDYGERNADTYSLVNIHGTHVAGIAAGKNGHYNGMVFSGTAPEAQLVLMKVSNKNGYLPDDVSLAAFDDVSKMGVCAVNYSISAPVLSWCFDTVMDNLRNAGIIVMAGVGNSGRSQETVDRPDYVYPSNPSLLSSVTAVASINADRIWATENKMILSSGDIVIYNYSDDIGFFDKFSDKPYDYVVFMSEEDIDNADIGGKIAVCSYELYLYGMWKFYDDGAAAVIAVLDGEQDGQGATIGEMPVIFVRRSGGDILYGSTVKKLRTFNKPDYYQLSRYPEMSYFTSWGTNTTLELKPEITAPGGNILSAIPDDEYANWSGTSMAAPHMAGAAAIFSNFMEEAYPGVVGADKVALMENIMMSSARIVLRGGDDPIPESPRRQGAGLVDLEAAAKLPVILTGSSGKSKLCLGDMLTNDIKLTFTAKNLTNKKVTYDDVKLYVMTDNYENIGGVNYVSDQVALSFTSDAKKSYTVPAGGETEITINISLDKAETAKNLKIFTNGFFVDGFVVLENSESKTGLPFTGFYGDWTAFDAMTPAYFEEGGSEAFGGLMSDGEILGRNLILNRLLETGEVSEEEYPLSEYEGEEYAGYSPDGDGIFDYLNIGLYMLRSLTDTVATIYDAAGNEYWMIELIYGFSRNKDGMFSDYYIDYIPDGDYTMTVKGRLAYDSDRSRFEEKLFKFYVDTVRPEISEPRIYEEGGKTYAAFSASDDRYLMGAVAYESGTEIAMAASKPSKNADFVLDITGADINRLSFAVSDYACNVTRFTIDRLSAELIAEPVWRGNSLTLSLGINNTGKAVDADIYVAAYSADGELQCVAMCEQYLESGQQVIRSFDLTNSSNAAYATVFVWKHASLVPAMETYEIQLM